MAVRTDHLENREYFAMLRRMIRAGGRRVGRGDVDDFGELLRLDQELTAACRDAIVGLRASGFTWAEIGRVMGTSRQAALMRWGGSDQPAV